MLSEKLLSEMMAFNEELVKAGIMLDGAGLHPSSKGARIRFSSAGKSVIDGPFAETKELIAAKRHLIFTNKRQVRPLIS